MGVRWPLRGCESWDARGCVMREWSDDVRSGMTTSSSVLLTGRESPRESPRDDRGRDEKLAGIASLSSLNPHVAIYDCFTLTLSTQPSASEMPIRCYGRRPRVEGSGWSSSSRIRLQSSGGRVRGFGCGRGRERETESSKQAQLWRERLSDKRKRGSSAEKGKIDSSAAGTPYTGTVESVIR